MGSDNNILKFMRVGKKTDMRCAYCGYKFNGDFPFELDHIIPISRGGNNHDDNLILACRTCNRAKKDKTMFEFQIHLLTKEPTNNIKQIRNMAKTLFVYMSKEEVDKFTKELDEAIEMVLEAFMNTNVTIYFYKINPDLFHEHAKLDQEM